MDEATRRRIEDGERCLEEALYYLDLGWSVLPNCYPDHIGFSRDHVAKCTSPGKSPWITWKPYYDRLPTADDLRHWWRQHPSNVGMALGSVSGCVRIDIEGEAGEAKLLQLSGSNLPATLEFHSGRGGTGRGLLYSIPDGAILATTFDKPKPGEEVRFQAKGAQTVLPPSRHHTGRLYTWKDGHSPGQLEMAVMPDWLIKRMSEKAAGGSRRSKAEWEEIFAGAPDGARHDTALAFIGKLLGAFGDLENSSAMSALWAGVEAWNERNDPPLDDDDIKEMFCRLHKAELSKRRQQSQDAINRYAAAGVQRSVEQTQANGTTTPDGSNDLPEWHVITIHSEPPAYKIRSFFWAAHPGMAKNHGYVTVSAKEAYFWNKIRLAVFVQGGPADVPPVKDWGKLLEELKKAGALFVLAFIYRYLANAGPLPTEPENGTSNGRTNGNGRRSQRRPFIDDDGLVRFKVPALLEAVKEAKQDFSQPEIMNALENHSFHEGWFKHSRWWKIKPEDLDNIAILTREVEPEGCATAPQRQHGAEDAQCGAQVIDLQGT